MYTVLYQWKVHHDKHSEFIAGWEAVTDHYVVHHNSLGSMLHEISDDNFVAYARWPSKQARDIAFDLNDAPLHALNQMQESIITNLKPVEMSVISNKLITQL